MNVDLKKRWAWPGKLVGMERRSRPVRVVLALVSFVVARCKINGAVEFQASGDVKFDSIFEDSRDSMAKIKQTYEGIRTILVTENRLVDSPKVEDITPAGGYLMCRVISDKPFKGKMKLTEWDGKYHLKYYSAHDGDDTDMSDLKARIVVGMSGKVTRSSPGKVQGDKVILEGLDFPTYGVEVAAEKEAAGPASSSGLLGEKAGVSSLVGGFPVWAWAVVGTDTLVVIAGLALVAGRCWGVVEAFLDGSPFRPTGSSVGREFINEGGGEDPISSPFDVRGM